MLEELMAVTRSMSGATKKIVPDGFKHKKSKPKPKPKSKLEPKSKPKLKHSWVRTIEREAFDVFMLKDFALRYSQKHPFPVTERISEEDLQAGHLEWANMSGADKDVWIEYTKKRKAEGASVWTIADECYPIYNRRK